MTSPNALSPLDCHNAMETAAFDFADARNKMVDIRLWCTPSSTRCRMQSGRARQAAYMSANNVSRLPRVCASHTENSGIRNRLSSPSVCGPARPGECLSACRLPSGWVSQSGWWGSSNAAVSSGAAARRRVKAMCCCAVMSRSRKIRKLWTVLYRLGTRGRNRRHIEAVLPRTRGLGRIRTR